MLRKLSEASCMTLAFWTLPEMNSHFERAIMCVSGLIEIARELYFLFARCASGEVHESSWKDSWHRQLLQSGCGRLWSDHPSNALASPPIAPDRRGCMAVRSGRLQGLSSLQCMRGPRYPNPGPVGGRFAAS